MHFVLTLGEKILILFATTTHTVVVTFTTYTNSVTFLS